MSVTKPVFINRRFFLHLFVVLVASGSLFLSCSKEPIRPTTPTPDSPPITDSSTFADGFFIVNEGNFNWGNASITFVDSKENKAYQQVFEQANNRPLGDVAQSMKILGDRAFIIVNNSNTIEVVSLKDFTVIKSIQGFNSPRYIEFIDSAKAYVTNIDRDISVIDLNTLTVTKTISTTEWTEGMVKYQNYVFITCIGNFSDPSSKRKAKLFVIDTKEDRIIDSIQTGTEPLNIVIDKKQKLWVLCSGGWDNFEPPSIIRVNPELRQVEKAFSFQSTSSVPSKLEINPSGDTLYFLNNGIFQMPVTSNAIPTQPFIAANGRLFYGLSIHPVSGTIFATDAIDYVQDGIAFQFSSKDGSLLNSWGTGRIPGSFCFGNTTSPKDSN